MRSFEIESTKDVFIVIHENIITVSDIFLGIPSDFSESFMPDRRDSIDLSRSKYADQRDDRRQISFDLIDLLTQISKEESTFPERV